MKHLIFILSLMLSASCSFSSHKENMQENQIYIRNVHDKDWLDRLECQFIPLETTDSCLISFIDQLLYDGSRFYIVDGKSHLVYVFDRSGKFLAQVGNVGQAPSEYILPQSIHADSVKQELVVADAGAAKLIYYDLNTFQYKKSRHMDYFGECAWLNNGDIAWAKGEVYKTPQREEYYVIISDADLNIKRYDSPAFLDPHYQLRAGSYFYTYNDQVYLNLPFSSSIIQIGTEENKEKYQIAIEGYPFANIDWLKANAEHNYATALMHSDYIAAMNLKETERFISVVFLAGGKSYIGYYDKRDKKSMLYSGIDFMKETTLHGLGRNLATYEDFFLAAIDASSLEDEHSRIAELESIKEQLKPESNPIICFLKFQ